jgi:hypothetical protein
MPPPPSPKMTAFNHSMKVGEDSFASLSMPGVFRAPFDKTADPTDVGAALDEYNASLRGQPVVNVALREYRAQMEMLGIARSDPETTFKAQDVTLRQILDGVLDRLIGLKYSMDQIGEFCPLGMLRLTSKKDLDSFAATEIDSDGRFALGAALLGANLVPAHRERALAVLKILIDKEEQADVRTMHELKDRIKEHGPDSAVEDFLKFTDRFIDGKLAAEVGAARISVRRKPHNN